MSFAFALLAPCAIIASAAMAATMPPVKMKVVDDEGKPVAGVVAFFTETAHQGTLTGHGGKSALLFAAEAVSDEGGELSFPRQEFTSHPFFLNTIHENPSMLFLKPGYAPLTLRNELRIMPTLAEASVWEKNGRTVTMKPANKDDPYNMESWHIKQQTSLGVGTDPAACTWKKVPRTLVTADRMYRDRESALHMLLMNDALFARHGCGSPGAFFAPYLESPK